MPEKSSKNTMAPLIKGGGGGQKNLATAGGEDASNLREVIEKVKSLIAIMYCSRLCCLLLSLFLSNSTQSQNSLLDSFLNERALKPIVAFLSSDRLLGRFTGTVQADQAARFIANEFEKAGTNPVAGNEGYFMPILNSLGNVMGALNGNSLADEIVIFCAHYDHVGTDPVPALNFKRVDLGGTHL